MEAPIQMSALRKAYLELKQAEHEAQWSYGSKESSAKARELAAWESYEQELKKAIKDDSVSDS